jgi:hypothetical protein
MFAWDMLLLLALTVSPGGIADQGSRLAAIKNHRYNRAGEGYKQKRGL